MTELVSVLCAAPNSVYKRLPDVDVFDEARDARTFDGSTPIVAHPPCRAWSAFTRHQAKPGPEEVSLGLWCCERLKSCGGVLEQPAKSHLFQAGGLPLPGNKLGNLWSIEVWQSWWGYGDRKATWLCFSNVESNAVQCPIQLWRPVGRNSINHKGSKNQRAATCEPFAKWLIDIALTVRTGDRR